MKYTLAGQKLSQMFDPSVDQITTRLSSKIYNFENGRLPRFANSRNVKVWSPQNGIIYRRGLFFFF